MCMKKIHNFLTDREKVKSELYWIRKVYPLIIVLHLLLTLLTPKDFPQYAKRIVQCSWQY